MAFGSDTGIVTHSAAGAHRSKGLSSLAVVALLLAGTACLLVGFVGYLAGPNDRAGDATAVGSAAPTTLTVVAAPTASTSADPPELTAPTRPVPRPSPTRRPPSTHDTDPRYGTCRAVKAHGYGPYYRGIDPEYSWSMAIVTALAAKAAELTAGGVGSAFRRLYRLIRDRFGTGTPEASVFAAAMRRPDDRELRADVADALAGMMVVDSEFAGRIRAAWRDTTVERGGVVNHFNGRAENVLQVRDISGDVRFGQ